LLVCLVVSASLHAAVFVLLPGWAPENAPPAVSSLEIVILQPTLLPPAAAPLRHGMAQAAPQRSRAAAGEQPLTERATPEPVLPPTVHQLVPSSAAVDYREPGLEVPERRPPTASTAVTLPTYQAAYLSAPAPLYPEAARRAGQEGRVTLRVRVARDGAASRVAVEKSSGSPHLDAAALEAVKAWRFTPARRGADAVESWMLVPIVFRLDGAS
jgi:protein TonB